MNAKACPFCNAKEPRLARVHNEIIAECCDDLSILIETQDPDGETGLMTACFDRDAALIDWQGCVAFAASRIQSLKAA